MTEVWKAIPGFEGLYEVSDLGRVRSLDRKCRAGKLRRGRMKSITINNATGYLTVSLSRDGHVSAHHVHSLVLSAFVGPRPNGADACHFPDRDKKNCRLDNLRWDSRKNNHKDKETHGTLPKGERHAGAKLTDSDVVTIRALRARGKTFRKIAEQFGVATMTAYRAAVGDSWSHLKGAAQ